MRDLGALAKLVITRLCGHFWSRHLRRNIVRCLHFKCILIKISCDLRRAVFQTPEVGLHFGRFSLGPPFAKSPKMGDLGALAKFVITRLCGHFWSRRLRRNVVRCLHFKRILMKISFNLHRAFFQALKFGLRFGRFSLGSPFAKSRKMCDLGALAKFVITRLCRHFWSCLLRRNVVRCLHLEGL